MVCSYSLLGKQHLSNETPKLDGDPLSRNKLQLTDRLEETKC